MASTYKDLYDDWLSSANVYTERLQVTEQQFMRFLTRAMQVFQRETEIIVRDLDIAKSNNVFVLPEEVSRILLLTDQRGFALQRNEIGQLHTTKERAETTGRVENPFTVSQRTDYRTSLNDTPIAMQAEINRRGAYGVGMQNTARLYTIVGRTIQLYPALSDTMIHVVYIPILPVYSATNDEWQTFNSAFASNFENMSIQPEFAPYEYALISFVMMEFLKSITNPNFKEYKTTYLEEVERAKFNKQSLFSDGTANYYMSPFS